MKLARYQGRRIEAAPGAPVKAQCPDCQGPVTLRSRGGQFGEAACYFYRHVRGSHLDCTHRRSQSQYIKRPSIPVPAASLYKLRLGRSWYNILVETGMLSIYRVTRTWGKGGSISKGQSLTKDLDNRMDAEGYAQGHVLRLMRKGYDLMEWL